MNILGKSLLLSIMLVVSTLTQLWSQCAMCRAAVENNASTESAGFAAGLNTGILYLFVAPYLLVMVIGILWYRKTKLDARKFQNSSHNRG